MLEKKARALVCALLLAGCREAAMAQKAYTWQEIRDRFEATNPTLKAAHLNVDESRAAEVTAYLRPNPALTVLTDGTQISPFEGVWQPFSGTLYSPGVAYLHERQHKRGLRRESAGKATEIATSGLADQARTLRFSLRNAFVQTLEQQAILALARENLDYYDKALGVSRERFKAGDIARMDLDRLELQRIQFQSDVLTAEVNLRTAKIQLLALLNDRTPVEQFDVTGPFDFSEQVLVLDELRAAARATRPDLRAARDAVEKAKTDHRLAIANGSADPTFSAWWSHNSSFNNPFAHNTLGTSVSIPLRIWDRNQGEKLRTQLDIGRSEQLRVATEAQVFADVDSAYALLASTLTLLRPYKAAYLQQALRVRDTVSFAYQRGGASLLDFLNAQNDYRSVQRNYLSLVGSYLTAANQLNFAVGREVIP